MHTIAILVIIIIVNGVALAGHVTVGNYAIIGGVAASIYHIRRSRMISGGSF
jgi:UDP-N-acetylglucosamine acyltransferase